MIRITTYNILYPDFVFRERYPNTDYRLLDTQKRMETLINLITTDKSDVYTFQEADYLLFTSDTFWTLSEDYHFVLQETPDLKRKVEKWKISGGPKPHTCICATLVSKRYKVLSTEVKSRYLGVSIETDEGVVKIVNIHQPAHEKEARKKNLNRLSQESGSIIIGDFNEDDLTGFGSYTSGYLVPGIRVPKFTFYTINESEEVKRTIDYIFTDSRYKVVEIMFPRIGIPIPNSQIISDHIPITYTVQLTQ